MLMCENKTSVHIDQPFCNLFEVKTIANEPPQRVQMNLVQEYLWMKTIENTYKHVQMMFPNELE